MALLHFPAKVVRWSDYNDMIEAVIGDRGGIGYSGRWLTRSYDVNVLDIREECGLLSPPTDFRMKIEGYTLSRRLYAYTPLDKFIQKHKRFLTGP